MFPHVIQPLHAFEPRYVQMVEDAVAGDGMIAMALLRPGWEQDYHGRPPIHPVGCLGRIVSHSRLDNGEINLLLRGLSRVSILRETPPTRTFRLADVVMLEDLYPAPGALRRSKLRRDLLDWFRAFVSRDARGREFFDQLIGQQVSLGALTDIVAHSLGLDLSCKQELLAQWNVDLRIEALLERIHRLGDDEVRPSDNGEPFPPFSAN